MFSQSAASLAARSILSRKNNKKSQIAIRDWLMVLIGVMSLAVLFRWKVSNPALIAATAAVGLIAFPILEPTWVMVK